MKKLILLVFVIPLLLLCWQTSETFYGRYGEFDSLSLRSPSSSLNSVVTKEYIDNAVISLGVRYFLLEDSSDVAGYKKLSLTVSSSSEESTDISSLSTGDTLATFITDTSETSDRLLKGLYILEVTAKKTGGNKTLAMKWQLLVRDTLGNETLIAISGISDPVATTRHVFRMTVITDSNYVIGAGERIVIRLIADVSGTGSVPSIRIYYEGDIDSYLEVPANHEVFDNIFIPYSGAKKNIDLNNKIITNVQGIQINPYQEVDTLTWMDEWFAVYFGGTASFRNYCRIGRKLNAIGHYQVMKPFKLFLNADSIEIDSIQVSFDWTTTASDTDTVLFSLDTLETPITGYTHDYYRKKYMYITKATTKAVLIDLGTFTNPSFFVIRLHKLNGSTEFIHHYYVVFYKKYR